MANFTQNKQSSTMIRERCCHNIRVEFKKITLLWAEYSTLGWGLSLVGMALRLANYAIREIIRYSWIGKGMQKLRAREAVEVQSWQTPLNTLRERMHWFGESFPLKTSWFMFGDAGTGKWVLCDLWVYVSIFGGSLWGQILLCSFMAEGSVLRFLFWFLLFLYKFCRAKL